MPKSPLTKVNILALLACYWLSASNSRAQQLHFDHLTEEDGLSINEIKCILQDSKGFMWIGTPDGLNRHDGYRFKVYKSDPENPAGLRGNDIYAIHEDQAGTMWVGAFEGLHQYDRDRDIFVSFQIDPDNPQNALNNYSITSIGEDRQGNLWFGTMANGLIKFNLESKRSVQYQHDAQNLYSLSHNTIFPHDICIDRSGTLWIATEDGLNRFDAVTEKFFRYRHNPQDLHSISHNQISHVFEDSQGILWIGTYEGLNRFNPETDNFRRYRHIPGDPHSLSNNIITSIFEDRSGSLWIGTLQGGINRFDRKTNTFQHFRHDPFDPHGLSFDAIWDIYEDRTEVLWIGTMGGGIDLLNPQKNQFVNYRQRPDDPNSLSHNMVLSLWEDSSRSLWIGSEGGGLSRLRWDSHGRAIFTHYRHDPANPRSLSNDVVNTIYEDRSGWLWIGTKDGLNVFDKKSNAFYRYRHDPDDPFSLSQNSINAIYEDRSGRLWIGTNGAGLNKLILPGEQRATASTFESGNGRRNQKEAGKALFPQRLKFERIQHDPDNPNSLSSDRIKKIYEDRSQTLWVATVLGLNKFNRKIQTFTRYTHDPQNPGSISSNGVYIILEDREQRLWIGTHAGLNRFDRETETFIQYREKDGLASDIIMDIAEDDAGNLWIATYGGISRFDPRVNRFKSFGVRDGLQSNEFVPCLKLANGELVFGGDKGLTIFDPQKIRENTHIPPVVLTEFNIFNHPVAIGAGSPLRKSIAEAQEIHLSHRETFFSFEFAALDYRAPEKNRYAYKLEGFGTDWIDPGSSRFASYTNVPPGEYTLRVKASNNDGVWNEEGASVSIHIAPPPWNTWWAYMLYVVTFVGILYTLRRYELNRQQLKHGLELERVETDKFKELERLKSRFFANISHEFRTPLTLIKGPIEKWLPKMKHPEMRQDFEMTHRYSDRLLRLINQLLDLSKLESGRMRLQASPGNVVEMVRWVTMSFESLAKRRRIDLRFDTSEEEIIAYIDRDKLEKILTNLLSNAFKFTEKGGVIEVAVAGGSGSTMPSAKRTGPGDVKEVHSTPSVTPSTSIRHHTDFMEITIKDSGIGIPEDRLQRIFDRFYQVDSSATREREGTGIGLALTRELVELHKGEISVESELGKGSTFILRFPLGKDHLQKEEIVDEPLPSFEQPATSGGQQATNDQEQASSIEYAALSADQLTMTAIQSPNQRTAQSTNILIVEDNPDVRTYIRSYLRGKYRIMEAGDGAEGWQKAVQAMPDLIISDVMMPKLDGVQLCAKLKTDERTSHIPVILLTARASEKSKVEGLETGADDYLTKPFDLKELQVRIKNLIELRRKLREKFQQGMAVEPREVTVTSRDQQFLQRAIDLVEAHMPDEHFGIEQFSKEMTISRIHLNRKLQALTGQTTTEFIRTLRLKRAAQLLAQKSATVSEIAYEVGFNNLSYFARCFKEQFGQSPSDFAASHHHNE